jgi:hypothetical protein
MLLFPDFYSSLSLTYFPMQLKYWCMIQMDGFQEFEARRKKKFDKQIDSNVMIGSKGLDEGVDL